MIRSIKIIWRLNCANNDDFEEHNNNNNISHRCLVKDLEPHNKNSKEGVSSRIWFTNDDSNVNSRNSNSNETNDNF